jgi:serine/threonine protein kinase
VGAIPADGIPPETRATIVTEYMRNGTLKDALTYWHKGRRDGPFGPTEWSQVVFAVAATMAEIHAKDVIHRDLKPANILFDANMEPVIADLGNARSIGGPDMTSGVGTPLYMAPEMISGDPYDASVDVYAFGVLLHQMFTNSTVLDNGVAPTEWSIFTHVSAGVRFKPPANVPPLFWGLIQECWAGTPSTRPSFATIRDRMLESLEYTMIGTNMEKYQEFRQRLMDAIRTSSQIALTSEPIEETRPSVGLRVSDLARHGDTQAQHAIAMGSLRSSGRSSEKFNFTRHSSTDSNPDRDGHPELSSLGP